MGKKGIKYVKLLPCPLCGSWADVVQVEKGRKGKYYVECQNSTCGIVTPYGLKRDVVRIWNRRMP